jgi:hypothetical protein
MEATTLAGGCLLVGSLRLSHRMLAEAVEESRGLVELVFVA